MKRTIAIAILAAGAMSAADKERALAGEPLTTSRTIAYHASEIASVNAEVNFSTAIVFDKHEKILQLICGDADHWHLEQAENYAFLKPDPEARGSKTNIHIVMESGNVYTLVAYEISNKAGAQADLKLFINPGDESMLGATKSRVFVSANEVDQWKKKAEDAQAQLEQQKVQDKAKIANAQNSAPQHIRHDYRYDLKKAEKLGIKALYNMNGFTYIEVDSPNPPVLYELRDGKESLIEWELNKGVYSAPKVLNEGFLKSGKTKLEFKRDVKEG